VTESIAVAAFRQPLSLDYARDSGWTSRESRVHQPKLLPAKWASFRMCPRHISNPSRDMVVSNLNWSSSPLLHLCPEFRIILRTTCAVEFMITPGSVGRRYNVYSYWFLGRRGHAKLIRFGPLTLVPAHSRRDCKYNSTRCLVIAVARRRIPAVRLVAGRPINAHSEAPVLIYSCRFVRATFDNSFWIGSSR
jgi:hypothetical protein